MSSANLQATCHCFAASQEGLSVQEIRDVKQLPLSALLEATVSKCMEGLHAYPSCNNSNCSAAVYLSSVYLCSVWQVGMDEGIYDLAFDGCPAWSCSFAFMLTMSIVTERGTFPKIRGRFKNSRHDDLASGFHSAFAL